MQGNFLRWSTTGVVRAWWADDRCVCTWSHHMRLLLMSVVVTAYCRIQIDGHRINSLRSLAHWRQILKWSHWPTHVLCTAPLLHHSTCADQIRTCLLLLCFTLLGLLLVSYSNVLIVLKLDNLWRGVLAGLIRCASLRSKACCTRALLSHHNVAYKVLVLLFVLIICLKLLYLVVGSRCHTKHVGRRLACSWGEY